MSAAVDCREFERELCDYLDEQLAGDERRRMDDHRIGCASCAEALEEADFARSFLREVPAVEPPVELIAAIIHGTVGVGSGTLNPIAAGAADGGMFGWLRPWLNPVRQPRFVMSMAMTVLSFSMLAFYSQRAVRQYQATGTTPAATLRELSRPATVLWDRAGEVYEAAVAFYQLQTQPLPTRGEPAVVPRDADGAPSQPEAAPAESDADQRGSQ